MTCKPCGHEIDGFKLCKHTCNICMSIKQRCRIERARGVLDNTGRDHIHYKVVKK